MTSGYRKISIATVDSGCSREGPSEGERNQLGVLNGVYVPCLLNILGVILFLRLPWAVGQAGWGGVLSMFILGEVQTVLTVLSLAAMLSNGKMQGGGSYYMISRSLGPEMGGAMGILFYMSYAVGATFYAAGVGEEIQQTWFPDGGHWVLVASTSLSLLVCLLISLAGAGLFTKINVSLFVVLASSILVGGLSILFASPKELSGGGRHQRFSERLLRQNTWTSYTNDDACGGEKCTYGGVFAIIFPAVTGIMEGANLSGDLKDPGKDIGRGTLWAVLTAFIVYTLLMVACGGAFDRATLTGNENVLQDSCWAPLVITVGVLVSTASSCLGALFGGARILQALARDKLFPGTSWLSWGTRGADEPLRAVLLTWCISQACVFMGDLDVIAPIITSFFCMSYACTNLACFLVSVSGVPSFRPQFKWFSRATCLAGFFLNVGVMFYLDPLYAGLALLCMIGIFVALLYKDQKTNWGDVRQALIYQLVRKYLLKLDGADRPHAKTWRPSVLLLMDNVQSPIVHFAGTIKKGGICIMGVPIVASTSNESMEASSALVSLRRALGGFISRNGFKAFCDIAIGPTGRDACHNLFLSAGTGAMRPNTVIVPFWEKEWGSRGGGQSETKGREEGKCQQLRQNQKDSLRSCEEEEGKAPVEMKSSISSNLKHRCASLSAKIERNEKTSVMRQCVGSVDEYVSILNAAISFEKNLVVCRNFEKQRASVWLPDEEGEEEHFDHGFNNEIHNRNGSGRNGFTTSSPFISLPAKKTSIGTIDMWIMDGIGTDSNNNNPMSMSWRRFAVSPAALMMEVMHIIRKKLHRSGRGFLTLRVLRLVEEESDVEEARAAIEDHLEEARIDAEVVAIPLPSSLNGISNGIRGSADFLRLSPLARCEVINKILRMESAAADLVVLRLPEFPSSSSVECSQQEWWDQVAALTNDLPPTAMISVGDTSSAVIARDI